MGGCPKTQSINQPSCVFVFVRFTRSYQPSRWLTKSRAHAIRIDWAPNRNWDASKPPKPNLPKFGGLMRRTVALFTQINLIRTSRRIGETEDRDWNRCDDFVCGDHLNRVIWENRTIRCGQCGKRLINIYWSCTITHRSQLSPELWVVAETGQECARLAAFRGPAKIS